MVLGGSWLFLVIFVVSVVSLRFLVALSGYWCYLWLLVIPGVFFGGSWLFLDVLGVSWWLLAVLYGSWCF